MNIEQTVTTILHDTTDPLLGERLSYLPLKPVISLRDKHLTLELTAGFPSGVLSESVHTTLTEALSNALPEYNINIRFNHVIKAHKTQLPGKGLRGVKNVIAIASGKGGVGKSTVAVNLATALAHAGARVGLLDADIYGPSVPLMLGDAKPVEVRNDRYIPVHQHGIQAMSIGYLTTNQPALIWRGPMLAKSLLQMMDITDWDDLDYLFIDLPPGTGDIQLSLVQKIPLTAAIVVTTPQTVATLDAQKAIQMFEKTNIDVLGIIENMSLHHCSQCGYEEAIFGSGGAAKICADNHCKLLGRLPLDRTIGEDCDKGCPTAINHDSPQALAFTKIALTSMIELATRPLNYADKFPPIKVE